MTKSYGWVTLRNGDIIKGHHPGECAQTQPEHPYRDALARQLNGAVEATVPYGRADVRTTDRIFEVKAARHWRKAVNQAVSYGAQTGLQPAIAIFGQVDRPEMERIYLKLRDGPGGDSVHGLVELWWWTHGRFTQISARKHCTGRYATKTELLTDADEAGRALAKRRWPTATWIDGDGPYALLAHCDTLTITLWPNLDQANRAKRTIDRRACGHACHRNHQIIPLKPNGHPNGHPQNHGTPPTPTDQRTNRRSTPTDTP